MKILVFANDDSWNELIAVDTTIEWIRAASVELFSGRNDVDAYFNLYENAHETDYNPFKKIVFINSVVCTLKKINAGENVFRINGWNGFLQRTSWEVAGKINDTCLEIFKALNKTVIPVPDEPGFIAARIISMIINEAYFAKEENVSTEKEIDIAMKLGTNYPFGPFEWCKIIGIKNIYTLLKALSINDLRYTPSQLLKQEAVKNK